jgi:hypothetical protein
LIAQRDNRFLTAHTAGNGQIHNEKIDGFPRIKMLLMNGDRFFSVGGQNHLVAKADEHVVKNSTNHLLIVHDKNFQRTRLGGAFGFRGHDSVLVLYYYPPFFLFSVHVFLNRRTPSHRKGTQGSPE